MNDFLEQGYEVPQSGGGYFKLKDGENRFRILSKPIIGWLDWKDKVPFRFQMKSKPEKSFDPAKKVKHFWAFVVFDYSDKTTKVFEITQASIQSSIANYSKNEEWGAPFDYDITITRKGKDMDTEYFVSPSPKKILLDEYKKIASAKPVNLQALFTGGDPWATSEQVTELAIFDLF